MKTARLFNTETLRVNFRLPIADLRLKSIWRAALGNRKSQIANFFCSVPLCLCVCSLLRGADVRPLEATVVTLEGEEQKGVLSELSPAGCKLDQRTIPLQDVTEIRFSANEKPPAPGGATLCLRNGDMLARAEITAGNDTSLRCKTTTLGEIDMENKFLDAIVFASKNPPDAEVLKTFLKSKASKEDAILMPKGDSISGFFEKFSAKDLSFNSGGQTRVFVYDQIAAVRLAPLEQYQPKKELQAVLHLRDGSHLTGKLDGLQGSVLKLEALNGQTWSVNSDALQSILFRGGKLVYVSALEPAAVDQKPYAGGAPLVFAWRRDRSVTNAPIQLHGALYEHGIGVHSYCKLTYQLEGQYAKFLCDVGIDDAAPQPGNCNWQVIVDGKEAASGIAKAGGERSAVKVALTDAKQLELICDYGPDDLDTGDHLDWANARLLKP